MRRPRRHRARRWALVDSSLVVQDGTAIFRVSRDAKTPNVTYGAHWSAKHRETQDWQRLLGLAFAAACGVASVYGRQIALNRLGAPHEPRRAPRQRYTVLVRREVPSRRNFIHDDDNLRFCTKPINDALKRLGFIYDDRREWLTQPLPIQTVSADGRYWTEICVTPWWPGPLGPALVGEDEHWRDLLAQPRAGYVIPPKEASDGTARSGRC